MSRERLEKSLAAGGAHALLAALIGDYKGVTCTWFEPDKLADEQQTRATVRHALGGRFAICDYETRLVGTPQIGTLTLGYHLDGEEFVAAWIDSCHMGTDIMRSTGPRTRGGFALLGYYPAPDGPPWGWRTELDVPNADRLFITMFNISPEGEEAKAVEMRLERAG